MFIVLLFRLLTILISIPIFYIIGFYILLKPTKNRSLMKAWGVNLWAKFMCKTLGIKLYVDRAFSEIKGQFIVSNHMSYTDIFVLAASSHCTFIAKSEVQSWPIIRSFCKFGGVIFVQRQSARHSTIIFDDIKKTLKSGVNVILFPEGTTSNGTEILPFKSMFFQIPASLDIAVVPVVVSYQKDSVPINESVSWYGDMPLLPHAVKLLLNNFITATVNVGKHILCASEQNESQKRKYLATNSYIAIKHMFEQIK